MKQTDVDVKKAPTKEQIEMLERAARRTICYDEECPPLSEEELKKLKRVSDKE